MILSVHQPQYIPWLGYFHKIAKSDLFIFLDDVQYKKREFQNRNKIKTVSGPLWLTVPVITKGLYTQNIKDVKINNDEDWAGDHLKSIEHNYAKAANFQEHKQFFQVFYRKKHEMLMDASMEIINYSLNYLRINTPVKMSSEFKLTSSSTNRIIDLCKAAGADTYLSGSGGRDYMDVSLFEQNNIKLIFQEFKHPQYPQLFGAFESYLSIIDLFFNCGPKSRGIILEN
jgi:hypothetical protein